MNKQLGPGPGPFEGCRETATKWLDEGIPDREWPLLESLGFRRPEAHSQSFESFLQRSRSAPIPSETLVALVVLARNADFADVAGYASLTATRKRRLFAALLWAKRRYDLLCSYKDIPRGSGAKPLERLAQGVSRITGFDDAIRKTDSQAAKARRMLNDAGERWAHQECEATERRAKAEKRPYNPASVLPPGFPTPMKIADATHYGAAAFIDNFLESARIMRRWIADVQPASPAGAAATPFAIENSPTEWLFGVRLPAIYKLHFRQDFKVTIWQGGLSRDSEGARFAQAAGVALGMGELAFPTIRTHWTNAQKRA